MGMGHSSANTVVTIINNVRNDGMNIFVSLSQDRIRGREGRWGGFGDRGRDDPTIPSIIIY